MGCNTRRAVTVCCPVQDKNHVCTNLSFKKLILIFLSQGGLWMREAALTAIQKTKRGPFYGQKKLSIRLIHDFFVLITNFFTDKEATKSSFHPKEGFKGLNFLQILWIEGYKMTALVPLKVSYNRFSCLPKRHEMYLQFPTRTIQLHLYHV